jgi:hypothetical protein
MDEMHEQGVKLAVLAFEFDWTRGGSELKNWILVSESYYADYDYLGSQPITDTRRIHAIDASGLKDELESVGLDRAKKCYWFESPGHQHPARREGRAYKQVFLLHNAVDARGGAR